MFRRVGIYHLDIDELPRRATAPARSAGDSRYRLGDSSEGSIDRHPAGCGTPQKRNCDIDSKGGIVE